MVQRRTTIRYTSIAIARVPRTNPQPAPKKKELTPEEIERWKQHRECCCSVPEPDEPWRY